MACGEYSYKVNKYGRTTIPPMLRQRVGDKIILIYNPEHRCIGGYPSRLTGQQFSSGAHIEHAACDISERSVGSRGRFTIPMKLRQYAEIETVVVVVAADDYFELWNERNWATERKKAYAESVVRLGIRWIVYKYTRY